MLIHIRRSSDYGWETGTDLLGVNWPQVGTQGFALYVFSVEMTLSLTPCFSWVLTTPEGALNRFSGFLSVNKKTATAVMVEESAMHLAEARC